MSASDTITGTAAGVPFVAKPPAREDRDDAPIVVAWHLMDPPRTEAAMAAALPLDGLDAWRIYLGLPMFGSRMPEGGPEAFFRQAAQDVVGKIFEPVITGAAAEFRAALAALRDQLGMQANQIGLMGGSAGSSVAQLVMAEGDVPIAAAVLISPMIQLRVIVQINGREMGFTYSWSDASNTVADRLDFVARAGEIAERQHEPPILTVVGAEDDPEIRESAQALHARLDDIYADPDRVRVVTIAGMGHALAEEPGIEPAPQNANAAEVDRFAVEWFRDHLIGDIGGDGRR